MMQFVQQMNELGKKREPFFFMLDFQLKNNWIGSPAAAAAQDIFFSFPHFQNHAKEATTSNLPIESYPITFPEFLESFNKVKANIQYGNSFLCNLTCSTPIKINANLQTIFTTAIAKYKILYNDNFTCFSPETFVQIVDDVISTYPMKGTIDAALQDAEQIILQNPKEKAEHYTIVDLLRNDLAMVANNIEVNKFRYTDIIQTATSTLIQISSKISGRLHNNWHDSIGDIFENLLPAGSISGAPKQKTMQIIADAETHQRGYYTGVAGYYDGVTLDSCVMIRFIEQTQHGLVYKSGGGITINSDAKEEYEEMIRKIYIPT
jgi:para-aminobenzoate synthetase component I